MRQKRLNEYFKYIKNNRIVKIADDTQDIIVSDWRDFLRFLYSNSYYVESILWWEHLQFSESGKNRETLGYGGPIDPINDGYYYAETLIECDFSDTNTISDIEKYVEATILSYKPHVLVPSFTVKPQ